MADLRWPVSPVLTSPPEPPIATPPSQLRASSSRQEEELRLRAEQRAVELRQCRSALREGSAHREALEEEGRRAAEERTASQAQLEVGGGAGSSLVPRVV